MGERSTDALELLLPQAAPQLWQRAQRVTTFLRLLSDDARGQAGASVAVSLARARGVLERSAQSRSVRVHEELLRHHLYALVGCDSFAHFGECQGELQSAWSELEEQRAESPSTAQVPAPGESAASVAQRLLAGLERCGASAARVELWRARCRRAVEGPQAGEAAFEQLLATQSTSHGDEAGLKLAALAGSIECMLDRAAVRAARARLDAEGPRALADVRLRRLAVWLRVLAGEDDAARSLQIGGVIARGRLPRTLAELRARAPAKAQALSGQAGNDEALSQASVCALAGDPAQEAALARTRLGAALFTVWSLEGPGRARLFAHALAPAHRGRLRAWLASREGACADARQAECQLLSDARPRIFHYDTPRSGPELGRNSIDPATILAGALIAVRDARGDVRGWLNIEFDHHLVASQACLEKLANAWAALLVPRTESAPAILPDRLHDEHAPAASVLRSFVEGLALKTTQRRWSAFEVQGSGLSLVAQGGGALSSDEDANLNSDGTSPGARGEGRAVERAAATGCSVSFGEADHDLGLHRAAASGVAVPLKLRGRVAGVWLVESTRRRDFSAADLRRFEARAAALAPELAAAQFRAWHCARFGHDVLVSAAGACAGLSPEALVTLAASCAPLALSGPLGAGRRMLARRLHFESPLRDAPLERVHAEREALERAFAPSSKARGLIVEQALELPLAEQARLAQAIEARADSHSRVYLLLDRSLSEANEQGAIAPELAWLFSRVELRLEPLSRRRQEIAGLAQLFAAHFAAGEGVRTPQLDDGALALLWRQPWNGNVRELAQWMYRLVLIHPGAEVDARMLEHLGARFGQATLPRMPSRHPDRELLSAALESTANRKGTWNKTRAALYLGWDTDTLQSRINEAGLCAQAQESAARPPAEDPGANG